MGRVMTVALCRLGKHPPMVVAMTCYKARLIQHIDMLRIMGNSLLAQGGGVKQEKLEAALSGKKSDIDVKPLNH